MLGGVCKKKMTPLSWHSYAGKVPSLNATVRIVHVVWGHGVTMRVELSFLLAYAASRRHTNGLREHRLCSVDMALVQEFGQLQESTKVKDFSAAGMASTGKEDCRG